MNVTPQTPVFFHEEPAWMKKARTVPLRSTYDSRQLPEKVQRPA